jgi:hypothetical protein
LVATAAPPASVATAAVRSAPLPVQALRLEPPPVFMQEPQAPITPIAPIAPPRPAAATRIARAALPESAVPFDAALETILYSADRRLAIIDGVIVGLGDMVKGARVVEITAGAVLLRDPRGRLRRLTLAGRDR